MFFVFLFFGFLVFWLCDTEDTEAFSIIHSLKYSVFALLYYKKTHGLQTVLGPKVFFLVFLSAVSKTC